MQLMQEPTYDPLADARYQNFIFQAQAPKNLKYQKEKLAYPNPLIHLRHLQFYRLPDNESPFYVTTPEPLCTEVTDGGLGQHEVRKLDLSLPGYNSAIGLDTTRKHVPMVRGSANLFFLVSGFRWGLDGKGLFANGNDGSGSIVACDGLKTELSHPSW
jgi:hypothetical protein